MSRLRVITGIAGTLLLIISMSVILYASNTVKMHYGSPIYYPVIPPTGGGGGGTPPPPALIFLPWLLFLMPMLLMWLVAWKVKNKQPFLVLFHQIVEWVRRHFYLLTLILTLAYLLLFLFFWWQTTDSNSQPQTILHGKSPRVDQPTEYIAFAKLTGPTNLRIGTSDVITLTMWIDEGVAPISDAILSPEGTYIVTAYLQAVNFKLDEAALSAQSRQMLTTDNPAMWAWVISPEEKKLGRQVLIVRVYLEDEQGNDVGGRPYLSVKISVTDPIGLPPLIVYGGMAFGAVFGLPIWTLLFIEWVTRRKEKREKQRKDSEKLNKKF